MTKGKIENKAGFGTLAGTMIGLTSAIAASKIAAEQPSEDKDAQIQRYAKIIAETFLESELPGTDDIIKDYVERRTTLAMSHDATATEVISAMYSDEVTTMQAKQMNTVQKLIDELPNDVVPFAVINAKARNFIDAINSWDESSYTHKHMQANVTADNDYNALRAEARKSLVNAGIMNENGDISDEYCNMFKASMYKRWEEQCKNIESEDGSRNPKHAALEDATEELEAVLATEEPEEVDFSDYLNPPAEIEDVAEDIVSDVLNEHDGDDAASIIADLSEKVDIETIAETGVIDDVLAEAAEEIAEAVDESVAAAILDNVETESLDESAAELVVEAVVAEKNSEDIDESVLDEIEIVAPDHAVDTVEDARKMQANLEEGQALSFTQSFVAVSEEEGSGDEDAGENE